MAGFGATVGAFTGAKLGAGARDEPGLGPAPASWRRGAGLGPTLTPALRPGPGLVPRPWPQLVSVPVLLPVQVLVLGLGPVPGKGPSENIDFLKSPGTFQGALGRLLGAWEGFWAESIVFL